MNYPQNVFQRNEILQLLLIYYPVAEHTGPVSCSRVKSLKIQRLKS